MNSTFSVSLSGADAFSDFAGQWQSRLGGTFQPASLDQASVARFAVRSRAFRVRDVMFNRFENEAALRSAGQRVGVDADVRLWIVHRGNWRFTEPGGIEHTAPAGRLLAQTGRLAHFAAAPGSTARVLVLPAAEIRRRRGMPASGPADTAEVRLLIAHATMVSRTLDGLGTAGGDAARDTLAELARAAVGGGFDDMEPLLPRRWPRPRVIRPSGGSRTPTLSPATLARQLNVSTRTLQRAFANESRPLSAYVRERRLDEARRALTTPHRRMTITEIAARWQFADGGHFARAFRKRYDQTPTDCAAAAAREAGDSEVPAPRGRPGLRPRTRPAVRGGRATPTA